MAKLFTNDASLTAIANAIREKSGTEDPLVYPDGFISAIENIQTDVENNGFDVVFYDSLANDGNGGIANHYSASDFIHLTEMPENPDHSDFAIHGISIPMTSQGWNWTLAEAKAYVTKYGKLNIGQTYIPEDGKSHFICYVPLDAPQERWNTEIDVSVSGGNINWQTDDGNINSASGNINVDFSSTGWHDVKISAPAGVTYFPYFSSSKSNELRGKIQKIIHVFIGENVTSIGENAFSGCFSLTSVSIPNGIASIGANAFQNCHSISSMTIPNGVVSIWSNAFASCYSLSSVALSKSITSIGSGAFYYCSGLTSMVIPEGVVGIGNEVFYYCHSLIWIIIPDGVTVIGNSAFSSCYSLVSISIPNGATSIGANAFQSCYSLTSISIPNSVTSIGSYAFYYCCSVPSVTIPSGVTNIGNYAFYYMGSLTSIILPGNVASIGNNAFQNCYSLKNIIIERAAPPTLSNINAFLNLMPDYSVIVPAGSLSAYRSETNWSSVATHITEAS